MEVKWQRKEAVRKREGCHPQRKVANAEEKQLRGGENSWQSIESADMERTRGHIDASSRREAGDKIISLFFIILWR